jgi:hypothetical protein
LYLLVLITDTGVLITYTPVFADYSLVFADYMLVFADLYARFERSFRLCNHIEWGKYVLSKYPFGLEAIITARNLPHAAKFTFKTLVVNLVRVQGLYLFAIFALIRLPCLSLSQTEEPPVQPGHAALTPKEVRAARKKADSGKRAKLKAQQKAKVTNTRKYDAWVAGKNC